MPVLKSARNPKSEAFQANAARMAERLASMAKLKCGRQSHEVTYSCLQYWGGMGFTWDNPLSEAYRDSRPISLGGGARSTTKVNTQIGSR